MVSYYLKQFIFTLKTSHNMREIDKITVLLHVENLATNLMRRKGKESQVPGLVMMFQMINRKLQDRSFKVIVLKALLTCQI